MDTLTFIVDITKSRRKALIAFLASVVLIFSFNQRAEAKTSVLFIGDSLTAGYGVKKEYAYPSIVQELAKKEGKEIKVLNGAVSGSTTSSGLDRLNWYLKFKPDVLVLALGANDGLRGIKVEVSRKNLETIIKQAKSKKIKILLAGMQLPPNYGKKYITDFKKMFQALAKEHKVKTIPFVLEGVAGEREYNLEDGIHPNKKGQQKVAETVYKYLKEFL